MNAPILLQMRGVSKAFGNTQALDNVSFELRQREIHGLLGGNGAGKTTLMNILFGLYRADAGEIFLNDQPVHITGPKDAISHRINMVHQHFLQVGSFTVLENILIGAPRKNRWNNRYDAEVQKIQSLQERFGLQVPLDALIEDLPMGMRQKVEILKALYRGVQVLILDEPTTNLTPQEVDALFQSLRVMVQEGLSVVFITHKLREVMSVCDRITVLRNGKNVLTLDRQEASEDAFVRAMVGEGMDLSRSVIFAHAGQDLPAPAPVPLLRVEGIVTAPAEGSVALKGVSFDVREGEIFGIAGVAGNGQRELAEVVMGLLPVQSGQVFLRDQTLPHPDSRRVLKGNFAYIPEDRLHDGFLPRASVAHNLILGLHRRPPYSNGRVIDWSTVFSHTRDLIGQYNIKTSGPEDMGGNLSGGNIQRVMVARAFSATAPVLVAHNPTRGLDIPSMDLVYQKMLERKRQGQATLLISEDLDELMLMCDRIGVLYKGELLGIVERGQFEKYTIGQMMSGIRPQA